MKDRKSTWNLIFTIIGFLVVIGSAAALIIAYKDKINAFLTKTKDFVVDIKDNVFTAKAVDLESCSRYDEYADFADV